MVACAGWGLAGAVEDTPIDQAKAQFETNFWGAVRVVQAALPVMRRQGGGRIVLVGSIGGIIGLPFQAFYSASKFALEGYGESLAYEVAPFNIDVTVVEPGNVKTDFTASRRTVAPVDGESDYAAASAKAIGKMARDEAKGVPPANIAATVAKVLAARRPPRRISAGRSMSAWDPWPSASCPMRSSRGWPRAASGCRERSRRLLVAPETIYRPRYVHTQTLFPSGSASTVKLGASLSATIRPPAATAALIRSSAISGATQTSRWNR